MIPDSPRASSHGWIAHRAGKVRAGACVAILVTAVCPAQDSRPAGFWPDKATAVDPANRQPDARMQMERNAKRVQMQRYEAANAERKRQLEQDSARFCCNWRQNWRPNWKRRGWRRPVGFGGSQGGNYRKIGAYCEGKDETDGGCRLTAGSRRE